MTTRLNIPDINWLVSASKIQSNYGQNITLDACGNSNVVIMTDASNVAVFGPNTIAGTTYNTSLNVNGPYFTNGVSATQIAADTSNNRPYPGLAGYIRFNTTANLVEYWNIITNSWSPISAEPPIISSISPNYVPEDSSFNYTVTGNNFDSTTVITFKGNVDNNIYSSFGPTNYINNSTLTVINTLAMSDASINTGFFVIATSTSTGLSYQTPTAILNFNSGPVWITAANSNLGTGISSSTYTTVNSPYTDLSANDFNIPVTFRYDPSGSTPVGASLITLSSAGKLFGTTPTLTTSVTSTYSFSAVAVDASFSISPVRTFFFTVSLPIATITGGTSIVGYTDSSGNNFTQVGPYLNGYTVYVFTAGTGIQFTTTQFFPPYVSYLVVGGGGAGGAGDSGGSAGGGGGAGGYLSGYRAITAGTTYTINVGAGGTGTINIGNSGGSSSISGTGISLTAAGGGGGANNFTTGAAGGSGGGGGLRNNNAGGAGNTPSTTPSQGNAGGPTLYGNTGSTGRGGGGGGALARGAGGYGNSELNLNYAVGPGGTGGSGIINNIRGTGLVTYSGGGGAGAYDRLVGSGGSGGGGAGSGLGNSSSGFNTIGTAGTANTGGGGGGTSSGVSAGFLVGGAGGSGIVILRHLSNIIASNVLSTFTINGSSNFSSPISGTYVTYPGYTTGTNTTPGTATVTYVDANGINPRAFGLGPYSGGYTIVTFTTTTPDTGYTWNGTSGTYRSTKTQVLYYANKTDFSFNATAPFPAQIEYLIVAGGGTGAKGTGAVTYGGGGGAGQVLAGTISVATGTTYTISVGSGAVMDPNLGTAGVETGGDTVYYNLTANGANSSAFGLTATGGQGGNGGTNTVTSWNPAGTSGVGGQSGNGFLGGLNGGGSITSANGTNPAGGGGGAADFGRPPNANWTNSGGYGIASAISGTYTGYGGGGGGGGDSGTNFNGGTTPAGVVIGGRGGGTNAPTFVPTAGAPNTGSGGGGMRSDDIGAGGGGGTGIIILKFPSFVC
jgi:hypothetical protein